MISISARNGTSHAARISDRVLGRSPVASCLSLAQALIRRAYEEIIRPGLEGLAGTTVYYKFKKRLEFEWNMLIGGTYQFNRHWAVRAEYGFLQSKQQLTFIATYNFGL